MAIDVITMALANQFTTDTVAGAGAIKGAPCEVESIEETSDGAKVNLKWEDKTGTVHRDSANIKASEVAEKIADDLSFGIENNDLFVENKE